MSSAPRQGRRPVSPFTWVLRALWTLIAAVLVVAILVGIIRGTFHTDPDPAPETAPAAPDARGSTPSAPR